MFLPDQDQAQDQERDHKRQLGGIQRTLTANISLLGTVEQRMGTVEHRLYGVEHRLSGIVQGQLEVEKEQRDLARKVNGLDAKADHLNLRFSLKLNDLNNKMDQILALLSHKPSGE